LFWKIEKDGHVAYVLGTIHLRVHPRELPDQVWNALAASSTVMVERDASTVHGQAKEGPAPSQAMTVAKLLNSSEFSTLRALIEANWTETTCPFEIRSLNLVTALALTHFSPRDLDDQATNNTLDQQVAYRAHRQRKNLVELDIQSRTDFSKIVSIDDVKRELAEDQKIGATQVHANITSAINKTADRYRYGECESTSDAVAKTQGASTAQTLLKDRNKNWLGIIESTLTAMPESESAFIATGCAHFNENDPESILNSLKADGYNVERVKINTFNWF
jgi:uncharacterized protein YbaP (TraB family)